MKRYGAPPGAASPGLSPSPVWVWQKTRPSLWMRQSPSLVRPQTGQGLALLLGVKSLIALPPPRCAQSRAFRSPRSGHLSDTPASTPAAMAPDRRDERPQRRHAAHLPGRPPLRDRAAAQCRLRPRPAIAQHGRSGRLKGLHLLQAPGARCRSAACRCRVAISASRAERDRRSLVAMGCW